MIQQVFEIKPRQRDLHPTKEFWVSDTYDVRQEKIIAANGSVPHANMKFIREVIFEIKKSTTLDELKSLARSIKEECVIECFQISINRQKNVAHMLFDWYDYKAKQCFYLYESYQMAMSAMIVRKLRLPFPQKLNSKWLRYFLTLEYKENNSIYQELLEELKHKKLTKKTFRLLRQMTEYVEDVCETSAR